MSDQIYIAGDYPLRPISPLARSYNLTLFCRNFRLSLLFPVVCSESPRSPCCGNVPSFVDGIPGTPQGILYVCNLFPFIVSVCPVHEVLHCKCNIVCEFPNIPYTHIEGEHCFPILIIIHTAPDCDFQPFGSFDAFYKQASVFVSILQVVLFFSLEFS